MPRRLPMLQDVVAGGLCTGCGLCESLAGRDRIRMALSSDGHLRPSFHGDFEAEEQQRLLAACPGYTVVGPGDGLERAVEEGTASDTDLIWGPMRGLSRGWAADPVIRHRASAGGVLTALGCFLLASGRVEAVVHVRASPASPMSTEALVSRTEEQVVSGMQSRYGPAAPLAPIRQLLDDGIVFALIGKPCDVAGIRNLARHDARVATQVPVALSIFCGGAPSLLMAEKIAAHFGLEPAEVALFRFRGEGWPGTTHLESSTGQSFDVTYDDSWYRPQPWRYDMQWRCKICPDAIGELADVSAPDGWMLGPDRRPMHEEAPGVNVILERTEVGSELVRAATEAGYLERQPLSREDFEAMHADHRQRKLGVPARLAALGVARAAEPAVSGYRLEDVRREAPVELLSSQLKGTLRRVRDGQSREPVATAPPTATGPGTVE